MVTDNILSNDAMKNAYAVIIGIGNYQDESIPRLNFTLNDANELYEVLIDQKRVGIPEENIRLLLDEEATLENIKSSIGTWLPQESKEESTVIIFFSGHGGIEPETSGEHGKYLLPWNAKKQDLFATSISSHDFEGLLRRIHSNRLVMFLDACHSGGVITPPGTKAAKDIEVIDNICTDLAAGSGRAIIAASQGNQESFEDPSINHGIFAYHLLDALKGKADSDENGAITLTETWKHLEREVPKSARTLAGAIQQPRMKSDITTDFTLAIDYEKLERKRKRAEQEEIERKAEEDIDKLVRFWQDGLLDDEEYNKALNVYGTDYPSLNEKDNHIKRLTHGLLEEKISITNYITTFNAILGRKRKKAIPDEPAEVKTDKVTEKQEKEFIEEISKPDKAEIVDTKTKEAREVAASKAKDNYERSVEVTERLKKTTAEDIAKVLGVSGEVKPSEPETVVTPESRGTDIIRERKKQQDDESVKSQEEISRLKRLSKRQLVITAISALVVILITVLQLTGVFKVIPPNYELGIEIIGEGKVESYTEGTHVTLTPYPDSGWLFSRWTGDIQSSLSPISFTVSKDMNVTAVFRIK